MSESVELLELVSRFVKIVNAKGPWSEEARTFLQDHQHVPGFEDCARGVAFLADHKRPS